MLAGMVIPVFLLSSASSSSGTGQAITSKGQGKAGNFLEQDIKKNLAGWNGILFHCRFNETSNRAAKKICEKTQATAASLAGESKIPFTNAPSGPGSTLPGKADDALLLEVEVMGTQTGSSAAICAHTTGYALYSDAVEASLTKQERRGKAMPRSGELLVWRQSVIGTVSGNPNALVKGISEGVEQHLKDFFADYLRAQR